MIFIDISLSFPRLEMCILAWKESFAILDYRVLLLSGATELAIRNMNFRYVPYLCSL